MPATKRRTPLAASWSPPALTRLQSSPSAQKITLHQELRSKMS
jgi:hypothetical protein